MRLVWILLSAIIFGLFVQAHAIEPGDIAAPSMSVPNMDMPKPTITKPNMGVPEPKTEANAILGKNAKQSINQNGNESSSQTSQTEIEQEQEEKPTDVSGKWSIKFDDEADRTLSLNLWLSSKTRIMGYGTLTEHGTTSSVTASGSTTADELKLTVKSSAPEYNNHKNDEYDLDLFRLNDTMSGTYMLRSNDQSMSMGNITALRQ